MLRKLQQRGAGFGNLPADLRAHNTHSRTLTCCQTVRRVKIAGTKWLLCGSASGKNFFYNTDTRKSHWNLPADLIGVQLPVLGGAAVNHTTPGINNVPTAQPVGAPLEQQAKRRRVDQTVDVTATPSAAAVATSFASLQDGIVSPVLDNMTSVDAEPEMNQEDEMDPDEAMLLAAMAEEAELQAQEETEVQAQEEVLEATATDRAPTTHVSPLDQPPVPATMHSRATWEAAQFTAMLRENNVGAFTSYDRESKRLENDPRFRLLGAKARRAAFENFQKELANETKDTLIKEKEANRSAFKELLQDAKLTPRSNFRDFRVKYGRDARFKRVDKNKEKMALFDAHLQMLKNEATGKRKETNVNATPNDVRQEESVRAREREVHRARKQQEFERSRERDSYLRSDQTTTFQTLLIDRVRSTDARWEDAISALRHDPRWEQCSKLDTHDKEELYHVHISKLLKCRRDTFAELLDTTLEITLATPWDEARALVCADQRFVRFSEDDGEREAEYSRYIAMRTERAKREFRDLLVETKRITHETLSDVNDEETGKASMAELLHVLSLDRRCIEMTSLEAERGEILLEYLKELAQAGAPLPPTASRSKP